MLYCEVWNSGIWKNGSIEDLKINEIPVLFNLFYMGIFLMLYTASTNQLRQYKNKCWQRHMSNSLKKSVKLENHEN